MAVPKGGWEASDVQLEAAASREAFEEGPPHFLSSVAQTPDSLSSLPLGFSSPPVTHTRTHTQHHRIQLK